MQHQQQPPQQLQLEQNCLHNKPAARLLCAPPPHEPHKPPSRRVSRSRDEQDHARHVARPEEAYFLFTKYAHDASDALTLAQLGQCFADIAFTTGRAKNTKDEKAKWLEREFRKADADADGVLSLAEFTAYYNACVARVRPHFPELYEADRARTIGRGAFAQVVKARRASDGTMVAVKRINKREVDMALVHSEVAIVQGLRHDNLLLLEDVLETDDELLLMTQLMRGGDLFKALQGVSHFSGAEAVYLARQMVDATAYLHSYGVVHCDLKPSNILVVDPVVEGRPVRIKLADFGLSQSLASQSSGGSGGGDDELGADAEPPSAQQPKQLRHVCGTPEYFAPELVHLAQNPDIPIPGYDASVDCWAIGCIIYELLTGRPPFLASDENVLFYRITENQIDFPADTFGEIPGAIDLVLQLTKTDSQERCSCTEALAHPWLAPPTARKPPVIIRRNSVDRVMERVSD